MAAMFFSTLVGIGQCAEVGYLFKMYRGMIPLNRLSGEDALSPKEKNTGKKE